MAGSRADGARGARILMSVMGHSHAGHVHRLDSEGDRKRLWAALAVMLAVMALEIVGGVVGHSLALLSDAAHMLADAGALGLSLLALRLASRPARGAMTFGFSRAEVLSAQANGITLLILAAFIAYEGIRRLVTRHVHATLMLVIALAASSPTWWRSPALGGRAPQPQHRRQPPTRGHGPLRRARDRCRGRTLILTAGLERADPIASLLIAAIDPRRSGPHVGLRPRVPGGGSDGSGPRGGRRGAGLRPVWSRSMTSMSKSQAGWATSAHVTVGPDRDCHELRRRLETLLHDRFSLDHTTLQVDHRGEDLLEIAPVRAARSPPEAPRAGRSSHPTQARCAFPAPTVYVHSRSPDPSDSAPAAAAADGTATTDRSVRPARGFAFEPRGNRTFCDLRRQGSAYRTSNEQL